MATLRLGMVSTGGIAAKFMADLGGASGAEVVAVASRTQAGADAFAETHGIGDAHGSYEDLARAPNVDAVYIATPHSRHADDACLFLEAGKHVLCEKPFAITESEARRMIETAATNKRFLMEAMWSRLSPAWVAGRELIESAAIGQPRILTADFCFPTEAGSDHRLRNPDLCGGSLLDLGVYPLGLAWFLFGRPDRVQASAVLEDGVDTTTTILASWSGGPTARLATSIDADGAIGASVIGTTGTLTFDDPFHVSEAVTVRNADGESRIETPDNGLHHQVSHFAACIADGLDESPLIPHRYTVEMMAILDDVRAQIGLRYADHD